MAQVTTHKVVEGESHLVLHTTIVGDGTGELNNYVLISPSDLNPPRANNRPAFRILQAWWGCVWFDVALKFGAPTPRLVWTLTRDTDSHVDFRCFGGQLDYDTIPPGEYTGQILISTNGLAAGSQGAFTLQLAKTNAP